jgi:hypothetical protein
MDSCSVCLVSEIPAGTRCVTDCGHMFCKDCLDLWFDRGNRSCPLCRTDIQYIRHGEYNYRLVLKEVRPQQIQDNGNYMYIHTRFYNMMRFTFLFMTGIILFGLATRYMNHLDKMELERDYDTCTRNLTNHERLIHELQDDPEDVRVTLSRGVRWCRIPYYFLRTCN